MKRVFTEALSYVPKSLSPFHLAQGAKLPSYTPHNISRPHDVVSIKGNTSEGAPLLYTSGGSFSSSAGSFFRATNPLLMLQKSSTFYATPIDVTSDRPIDVTSDYIFKGIFGNEARVKDFLENILIGDNKILPQGTEIEGLTYIKTEYVQPMPEADGKKILFDLQIHTNKGIFIVEMQKRYTTQAEYSKRLEFYTSMAYSHQQIKGQAKAEQQELGKTAAQISRMTALSMKDYTFALPVISVSVISKDFDIFPLEVPCISYHTNKEHETGKSYMSSLSYVFVELRKFNEGEDNPKISKGAKEWLLFMKTQDMRRTYASEQVTKAVRYVQDIQDSKQKYDEYLRYEISEVAAAKELEAAKAEGEATGKAQANEEIKGLLEQFSSSPEQFMQKVREKLAPL